VRIKYQILSLVLLTCCSSNQFSDKEFKYKIIKLAEFEEDKVTPKLIDAGPKIKSPEMLLVFHDYLVFSDLAAPNEKLFFFDIQKNKVERTLLPYGRGSGKILSIWEIFSGKRKNILFVHDLVQSKLIEINIDSVLSTNYKYSREITLNGQLTNLVSIEQIADSLFVGTIFNTKGRLAYFDETGNVSYKGFMLSNFDNESEYIYGHCLRGKLTTSGSNIAVGYFLADIVDIFNIKGDSIISIHGPSLFWPSYDQKESKRRGALVPRKDTRVAYLSMTSNNDSIFCLMQGDEGNVILTFDWKGVPRKKYQITEYSLQNIAATADGHLFGTTSISTNSKLIFLKLK